MSEEWWWAAGGVDMCGSWDNHWGPYMVGCWHAHWGRCFAPLVVL